MAETDARKQILNYMDMLCGEMPDSNCEKGCPLAEMKKQAGNENCPLGICAFLFTEYTKLKAQIDSLMN